MGIKLNLYDLLFHPPQWCSLSHFQPHLGHKTGRSSLPLPLYSHVEGLGHMISQARLQGSLRGLKIHNHSPITHQQFMDNNLLMGHPCVQESKTFKRIISTFSKASSMTINQEKLEIFFFNTPLPTQCNISHILNFKIATVPSKYLGAPLIDSGLKHSSLKELLTKLELRMCQWTFRTLNLAG